MANGFDFDRKIFRKALDTIFEQMKKRQGIFSNGYKQFLPQWNLPSEFDHSPVQNGVKKPFETSLWLWERVFCDRKSKSSTLIKKALNAWNDKNLKWIFFPEEIVKRNLKEIKEGLKAGFGYSFSHPEEKSTNEAYRDNSEKLLKEYGGDPRKMIEGKSVEETRKNLMEFDKIGPGLSNLYITELISRYVALPKDPENALVKIDVHRERLPLSFGAIKTKKDKLHHGYATGLLEQEFLSYY